MRRFRVLILASLACLAVLTLASSAPAGDFADSPCSGEPTKLCPTATVGQPYSITFALKEPGDGCPTFSVDSGAFPPGLTLASDEGATRGAPTQAGSFTFYIKVTYTCGTGGKSPGYFSDQQYTINVNPGAPPKPKLTVTTPSLPDANVNQPYAPPGLTASGDTVNSWTLAGGTLPPGLTLASNGVISGTPTQGGTFGFTVQANGNGTSDTRGLSIFVIAPLELQSLTGKKAPTTGWTAKKLVNASLLTGVKAVGGRAPYTFSFAGAMPPGITLNTATGAIAGAGTFAGRFESTVTVTDAAGAKASVPWRFTILPLLDFAKGKTLPQGKVNRPYSAKIPVRGKDARTAQFAISGDIPPGLDLDETTGRLTGTLLEKGTYRVHLYAFSQSGAPISKPFVIRVRA
ncbi:MAG: Ig domain-containing protein [Gaiella sp.]|nr:Ig domain-containing protein [Gaiella sp.]